MRSAEEASPRLSHGFDTALVKEGRECLALIHNHRSL